VIDPDRRITRIYRADGTETIIGEREQLDGEDILPGFTCLLAEVLAD
jgi:Uma2 family endonuclease